MSVYLVTGGSGFIGSHIVDALVSRGHVARVLDNFSTGKRGNLRSSIGQIELIEGDIRDPGAVRKAVTGVDYVLHQAALPSVPRSIKDPLATHEANATGTLNVLAASQEAGVKRVVYASSSSVYGDTRELPKREEMTPRPLSPYAASKLAGEVYCRAFCHSYGLETVCLRYFNVFGPRQDPESQYAAVIPRFICALLDGADVCIYGDGEQTRDFTYVGNVVQANLLAATAPQAAGRAYNIACGERTSLLSLLRLLGELTGRTPNPVFEEARPGDVRDSLADVREAETRLGYAVSTSLEEGLRRTVRWMELQPV
jgi:nucleoside-diphosphate-sugar epimerase